MKFRSSLCFAVLLAAGSWFGSGSAWAGLDIVETKSGEETVWVVKDDASGKTAGIFWKEDGTSDFAFEVGGGEAPKFFWNQDRSYVAVEGGYARSQEVYLYQVTGGTLHAVEMPRPGDAEMAPITGLDDVRAEGVDAVAWAADGTLILHYWAVNRATSETAEPKRGDVWAFVQVTDGQAKILRATAKKPQ